MTLNSCTHKNNTLHKCPIRMPRGLNCSLKHVTPTMKQFYLTTAICGLDSVAGIATGYGLHSPGIESRQGWDFPHQSRDHTASCTMGTGYYPGVKSGRGMTLTPHPLLVQWTRKSRTVPLLPIWTTRPVSFSQCLYNSALYIYLTLLPFTRTKVQQATTVC